MRTYSGNSLPRHNEISGSCEYFYNESNPFGLIDPLDAKRLSLVNANTISRSSQHSQIQNFIHFNVDKPMVLCGIGIFGRSGTTYLNEKILIKLWGGNTDVDVLCQKIFTIENDGTPTTYRLLFDRDIELNECNTYTIELLSDNNSEVFVGQTLHVIRTNDVISHFTFTNMDPNRMVPISSIYWKHTISTVITNQVRKKMLN